MADCPKCGNEIADGASICKHCHAVIGIPVKPIGVTIVGILILILSIISLMAASGMDLYVTLFAKFISGIHINNHILRGFDSFSFFLLRSITSQLLDLARGLVFLEAVIGIYASTAIFTQKRVAIPVCTGFVVFSIFSTSGEFIWIFRILTYGGLDPSFELVFLLPFAIIRIVVLGWTLIYLRQHKVFFVK